MAEDETLSYNTHDKTSILRLATIYRFASATGIPLRLLHFKHRHEAGQRCDKGRSGV